MYNILTQLPDEVLSHIFSKINIKNAGILSSTSKQMREITQTDLHLHFRKLMACIHVSTDDRFLSLIQNIDENLTDALLYKMVDSTGHGVLSFALKFRKSFRVIQAIITACPKSVTFIFRPTQYNMIHMALLNTMNEDRCIGVDTVKAIIDKYPQGLFEINSQGRTPLATFLYMSIRLDYYVSPTDRVERCEKFMNILKMLLQIKIRIGDVELNSIETLKLRNYRGEIPFFDMIHSFTCNICFWEFSEKKQIIDLLLSYSPNDIHEISPRTGRTAAGTLTDEVFLYESKKKFKYARISKNVLDILEEYF